MNNFIKQMRSIAMSCFKFLDGGFTRIMRQVDALGTEATLRVTRFFSFLFWGTIAEFAVLILGLLLRSQEMVVFSTIITAIMLIIIYITFLFPTHIINFLLRDVIEYKITDLTELMRSALFPLLSAAFFITCLGSIVASRGLAGISRWTIVVYAVFIFALIMFSLFLKEKSLRAHIMILVIAGWYLLVYIFPIPTKGFVLRVEDTVNGMFLTDKSSVEGQIIIIPRGVQLYQLNQYGEFSKESLASDPSVDKNDSLKGKVISIEEDYTSNEKLYKVVLQNNGEYIGGKITYVSIRSILLINNGKEDDELLSTIEVTNTKKKKSVPPGYMEVKKGQRETIFSCSDNSIVQFESDGPFSVIERTTYDYVGNKEKLISKSQGRTSHYFVWGGSVQILAHQDIIIKAW